LIALVLIGTFLNGLFQVRQMQVIEKVEQKIFVRYSFAFADKIPKLDMEKMDNYYLPEVVNRFFETVSLQKGLDKLLLDIPTAIIQIALGIILLAFYHPIFIGFGIILLLIVITIIRFTSLEGLVCALKASDHKYSIANWIEEVARSIKSFKYASNTKLHLHKTDKILENYLDARTSYFKVLLSQYWTFIAFKILITAGMLIVGATLLVNQQINIGQFIAVDIVILTIINSIEKLIGNLDKVYDALVSIEKLNKVVEAESETTGSLPLSIENKGVSITFKDVAFSYPDGKSVLNQISFQLEEGSIAKLSGVSGIGKSTILRLLSGSFQQFNGNILVDGIPIKNYQLSLLRQKTGILLNIQEVFQGSLLENLTMGNANITLEEITHLTSLVGLMPFITSLSKGFDTLIDTQGRRLPSKIKHTILLVRALLGKHRLILLESPFDYLDSTEEAAVLNYIKKEKKATVLFISSKELSLTSYKTESINNQLSLTYY
jgi:ABC-type bacteriocin/lantibiotic exporter with double-glycine peptidase domain